MDTSQLIQRTFFRCDSLPSSQNDETNPRSRISTWIHQFKTDGIMSKAFRASDGRVFDDVLSQLPFYVAAHVGYADLTVEMEFSKKRSPFLSWSCDDVDKSLRFLDRTEGKALSDCRVFEADHFMFELSGMVLGEANPVDYDLPSGTRGLFTFPYTWSFENFNHILQDELNRAKSGDATAIGSVVLMDAVRRANEANPRTGIGLFIDVTEFLSKNSWPSLEPALVSRALERASRANEWLLFPIEGSESVQGITGRFSPNKYLRVLKWLKKE